MMRTARRDQTVYVGMLGRVLALDRSTGDELWRAVLGGSGFVNLTLDGDQLLATAKGEIFCLDAATGAQRWRNTLTGMGRGLMTVVTAASPSGRVGVSESEELQRQSAHDAAIIAAASS